jgi:hypothetical protein
MLPMSEGIVKPLFDSNCDLVGWIAPGQHIWDANMEMGGLHFRGPCMSADTGNWLGPVNGLVCLGQSGRVVARNPEQAVAGTSHYETYERNAGCETRAANATNDADEANAIDDADGRMVPLWFVACSIAWWARCS